MNHLNIKNNDILKILKLNKKGNANQFTKAIQNQDKNKLDNFFELAKKENINLFQYHTNQGGNFQALRKSCLNMRDSVDYENWFSYLSQNGFNLFDNTIIYIDGTQPIEVNEYLYGIFYNNLTSYNKTYFSFEAFASHLLKFEEKNFYESQDHSMFIKTFNISKEFRERSSFNYFSVKPFLDRFQHKLLTTTFFDIDFFNLHSGRTQVFFFENCKDIMLLKAKNNFRVKNYSNNIFNYIIGYLDDRLFRRKNYFDLITEIIKKTEIPFDILNNYIICNENLFNEYKYQNKNINFYSFTEISDPTNKQFVNYLNSVIQLQKENNIQFSFPNNFKINPEHLINLIDSINKEENQDNLVNEMKKLNIDVDHNQPFGYIKFLFDSYNRTYFLNGSLNNFPTCCSYKTFKIIFKHYIKENDLNTTFPYILEHYLTKNYEDADNFNLAAQKTSLLLSKVNDECFNIFREYFNSFEYREKLIQVLFYTKDETLVRFLKRQNGSLLNQLYSKEYANNSSLDSISSEEKQLCKRILKMEVPSYQENEINLLCNFIENYLPFEDIKLNNLLEKHNLRINIEQQEQLSNIINSSSEGIVKKRL